MTHAAHIDRPSVSLEGVGVSFGARRALDGLTFELPAGGISAILGPNGAGKTTLLRLLAGTLKPSSGRIAWPKTGTRTRVALVGQSVALYPFLTLRENCLAAGRMEGVRGAALQARTDAAIARTLCTGMEHQLAGRLSGGYQRRAAIAAALMGDAPLVILDEPTTGLDTEGRDAMVTVLRSLAAAGKTLVVTTHDFALADATADNALFLRDGRLQAMGPPERFCRELFAEKKHVDLALARPPDERQAAVLATMDGVRQSDVRYSLVSDIEADGCPQVLRQLHHAGLPLRETLIRDTGVAVLFERFCLDRASP